MRCDQSQRQNPATCSPVIETISSELEMYTRLFSGSLKKRLGRHSFSRFPRDGQEDGCELVFGNKEESR